MQIQQPVAVRYSRYAIALGYHRRPPFPQIEVVDVPSFRVEKTVDMAQLAGLKKEDVLGLLHQIGEEAVSEVKRRLNDRGFGEYHIPVEFSVREAEPPVHWVIVRAQNKSFRVHRTRDNLLLDKYVK